MLLTTACGACAPALPLARGAARRLVHTRTRVTRLEPCARAARESPVPVALLSGPLASAAGMDRALGGLSHRLTSAGFTVGLVDLPGVGLAQALPAAWTLDDVIADVHDALLRALAMAPVAIAHSSSALVCQKYLESWSLQGLVMAAPLPPAPAATLARWTGVPHPSAADVGAFLTALALDAPAAQRALLAPAADGGAAQQHAALLMEDLDALLAASSGAAPVEGAGQQPQTRHLCGLAATAKLLLDLAHSPVTLEPQPVPLLLLLPGRDALVTREEAAATQALHECAGDAEAVVAVPHAGHAVHYEPDVAACIARWVERRF